MREISNPHDSFFRETFSRIEIATDFLTAYLPHNPNIYKKLLAHIIPGETCILFHVATG